MHKNETLVATLNPNSFWFCQMIPGFDAHHNYFELTMGNSTSAVVDNSLRARELAFKEKQWNENKELMETKNELAERQVQATETQNKIAVNILIYGGLGSVFIAMLGFGSVSIAILKRVRKCP